MSHGPLAAPAAAGMQGLLHAEGAFQEIHTGAHFFRLLPPLGVGFEQGSEDKVGSRRRLIRGGCEERLPDSDRSGQGRELNGEIPREHWMGMGFLFER